MLRRAGNAPNQMTDTVKVESAAYFSIDQVAHKRRFAPFLGGRAPPECLSLFCWETDGESGFHKTNLECVRQNARHRWRLIAPARQRYKSRATQAILLSYFLQLRAEHIHSLVGVKVTTG